MVRFLLTGLLAVLGCLAAASARAAECPGPDTFRAEVLKVVRREFPGQAARMEAGGTIEFGGLHYDPENLRKRVCAAPASGTAEREQLIREHFQRGPRLGAEMRRGGRVDWAAAREQVVVQLVQNELAMRMKALRRPLVQGVAVVVVLDFPTGYAYLGEELPARWGVSREELFDQATRNLTVRTKGQLRSSGDGEGRVLGVGELDGYDAARILTPGLRKAAASLLGDPFRAAIPNRDFLVMWGRGNAQLATQASTNAQQDFETQPYPISPLILEVWADGRIGLVR